MILTEEQKRTLLEGITEKMGASPVCPLCHTKNWSVTDKVFELGQYNVNRLTSETTVYPVCALCCQNCAYVLFFNALVAGVITRSDPNAVPVAGEEGEAANA